MDVEALEGRVRELEDELARERRDTAALKQALQQALHRQGGEGGEEQGREGGEGGQLLQHSTHLPLGLQKSDQDSDGHGQQSVRDTARSAAR